MKNKYNYTHKTSFSHHFSLRRKLAYLSSNMLTLFTFLLIVLVACKKSATNPSQENNYILKALEYKTNQLLQDVKIQLYKCSNYDEVFGCQSSSLCATYFTDVNGEYTFAPGDLNQANQGIQLSKAQYWSTNGGATTIMMEPEAYLNISLKTNNSYPDTSLLALSCTGALFNNSMLVFKAPKDSTVHFRLFGNETNDIHWVVYTKDLQCNQYCIRDTLAMGTITINAQKFETVTSSLDY